MMTKLANISKHLPNGQYLVMENFVVFWKVLPIISCQNGKVLEFRSVVRNVSYRRPLPITSLRGTNEVWRSKSFFFFLGSAIWLKDLGFLSIGLA